MSKHVAALIHIEGGSYGISFPDFPGAVSAGKNIDEAVERGRALLAFHIAGMVEDDETLPEPRTLEELRKDKTFRADARDAAGVVFVEIDMPGKLKRVNVMLDENLIDAIDRAAGMAGQSRSGFLSDAARARLLKVD